MRLPANPCTALGGHSHHKKDTRPLGWALQVSGDETIKRLSKGVIRKRSYHATKIREFMKKDVKNVNIRFAGFKISI